MRTHCLVITVYSNKINFSAVAVLVEMEAFFCDEILQLVNSESSGETDDAELQIDALMLAASQEYEQTLPTPSRPDV